ncbi:MAG: hypothetical protein K0R38_4612 [Polyangiaceae bacterium]|nr:hypothetical protein [Polyangiaceae bacterium]
MPRNTPSRTLYTTQASRGLLLGASAAVLALSALTGCSDDPDLPGGSGGRGGTASVAGGNGGGASGSSTAGSGTASGGGGSASGGAGAGGSASGAAGAPGGASSGGTGGSAPQGGAAGSANGGGGAGGGGGGGGAGGSGGSGGAPNGSELWVSPTGADTNPGTQASPLKTLQKAALLAVPGTTIWMTAGTHSYDARVVIQSPSVNTSPGSDAVSPLPEGQVKDGTAEKPIRIWAAAGTRPIIDFQPQKTKAGSTTETVQRARGILFWAHHWHIRGLEIKNAADNCVHIAGSNNTFENLSIHDCGDTGLQITVPEALGSDASLGARNKIINCDSFRNFDAVTDGENADGFAAKDRVGPGNEFSGCRAYQNADDGWDFFYANQAITLDNCWAFDMKHPMSSSSSDGNGFKLGGQRSGMPDNKADHKLSKCFAFDNPSVGFDLNNNTGNVSCTGCGAWDNETNFEDGINHTGDATYSVTPAQAIAAPRAADGALPSIATL